MKILRISTRLYPDIGGPAKQAFLLSKFCSKNKIKCINITSKPFKSSTNKITKINSNFEIHYLPFIAPGVNSGPFKLILFFFKFFIYGLLKALVINFKNKIDLIHCHSPPPTGFIAYFLSKIFKVPYIYTIHGLDYPNTYILNLDMNYIARNANKSFSVSRRIIEFIKNRFGIENISWFPNLINSSEYFHYKSKDEKEILIKDLQLDNLLNVDDFIIVYIGHMLFLQKVKGMIDFLEAFSKFLSKIKDNSEKNKIKLLYIGDGDFSPILIKKIKEYNLNQNIFFLGKRNDIKKILAISDLLGLTSYIEGFPNVILEAMASKVPCIASDVGEIKHIIKDNGYIVNAGDINSIGKNIEQFYFLSEEKRKQLMENVYKHVRNNSDIDLQGKRLINIYYHLTKMRSHKTN